MGHVSTAKRGRDPDWDVLSRTRLAVLLRWSTETPVRVPASSSDTSRLLIGWQNRTSVRQGDKNKQTHYPWGISGKRRKLSLFKLNVALKFAVLLGRPTLLLFVHCARSSFSLDLLAGFTVWGCYEVSLNVSLSSLSLKYRRFYCGFRKFNID